MAITSQKQMVIDYCIVTFDVAWLFFSTFGVFPPGNAHFYVFWLDWLTEAEYGWLLHQGRRHGGVLVCNSLDRTVAHTLALEGRRWPVVQVCLWEGTLFHIDTMTGRAWRGINNG